MSPEDLRVHCKSPTQVVKFSIEGLDNVDRKKLENKAIKSAKNNSRRFVVVAGGVGVYMVFTVYVMLCLCVCLFLF